MKTDDTSTIPEAITAPWLKRFFKSKLGIPVRVENAGGSGWVRVWIMSDRTINHRDPLRYSHRFPGELCQRCMAIVYEGHNGLSQQTSGGNISSVSIAMFGHELRRLLQGLIDKPIICPRHGGLWGNDETCPECTESIVAVKHNDNALVETK